MGRNEYWVWYWFSIGVDRFHLLWSGDCTASESEWALPSERWPRLIRLALVLRRCHQHQSVRSALVFIYSSLAATSLKRSLFSNTSCFFNLYLFECIRKCKFKSYLNFIMMTIGKYLSLAKKKLDCLRIKMSKKVRLRRVKVKDLAHNRQIRENTIPTDLSSK